MFVLSWKKDVIKLKTEAEADGFGSANQGYAVTENSLLFSHGATKGIVGSSQMKVVNVKDDKVASPRSGPGMESAWTEGVRSWYHEDNAQLTTQDDGVHELVQGCISKAIPD